MVCENVFERHEGELHEENHAKDISAHRRRGNVTNTSFPSFPQSKQRGEIISVL